MAENKGHKTEEIMREYFLRAGFFVVRGVNVKIDNTDLTDADLWIYERSATLARRRTIIDIKDKKKPQAAERLFFINGLSEVLQIEGAGIITTDKNLTLRKLAQKNKLIWIDGDDIQRIKKSKHLQSITRLSEESFLQKIDELDRARGGKKFKFLYEDIKSTIADRFGASSANISLDAFGLFSVEAIKAHPNSSAAKILNRLSLYSAALTAISLDYASVDAALRPAEERVTHMTNLIRYGEDLEGTHKKLSLIEIALTTSLANGASLYKSVRDKFLSEAESVPAESLAQIVIKLTNSDALFQVARNLEAAAFNDEIVTFDELPVDTKSFLGALLDFYNFSRKDFSNSVEKIAKIAFHKKVEETEKESKQLHFFHEDKQQEAK